MAAGARSSLDAWPPLAWRTQLPIILFHGGFHFGGTLTRVLMWLLIFTVFSGLFGAVLQHYIPRVMTADVPLEIIYDEIGNVRNLLLEEADRAMESLCGAIGYSKISQEEIQRAGGGPWPQQKQSSSRVHKYARHLGTHAENRRVGQAHLESSSEGQLPIANVN
jgi:hypothetical protein